MLPELSKNKASDAFYKAAIGIGALGGAAFFLGGIGGMGGVMAADAILGRGSPLSDTFMTISGASIGLGLVGMTAGGVLGGIGAGIEALVPEWPSRDPRAELARNIPQEKQDFNGPRGFK